MAGLACTGLLLNLIGGSVLAADPASSSAKQAMFATKAEAEKAAPQFGCSGAHKIGDFWMVCENHGKPTHEHKS